MFSTWRRYKRHQLLKALRRTVAGCPAGEWNSHDRQVPFIGDGKAESGCPAAIWGMPLWAPKTFPLVRFRGANVSFSVRWFWIPTPTRSPFVRLKWRFPGLSWPCSSGVGWQCGFRGSVCLSSSQGDSDTPLEPRSTVLTELAPP